MSLISENTPLDLPTDEEILRFLREVPSSRSVRLHRVVRAALTQSRTSNLVGRIVGAAVVSFVQYALQQGKHEDWIMANFTPSVRRLVRAHLDAQLDGFTNWVSRHSGD